MVFLNFCIHFRAISSVGLEHYLDRVGVTGSNPDLFFSLMSCEKNDSCIDSTQINDLLSVQKNMILFVAVMGIHIVMIAMQIGLVLHLLLLENVLIKS